jgi:hypothetical protein
MLRRFGAREAVLRDFSGQVRACLTGRADGTLGWGDPGVRCVVIGRHSDWLLVGSAWVGQLARHCGRSIAFVFPWLAFGSVLPVLWME